MKENECIRQASVNMVFTFGILSAYDDRIEFHSNNGKKEYIYYYKDIIDFYISMNTVLCLKLPENKEQSFNFNNKTEANEWIELATKLKATNPVKETVDVAVRENSEHTVTESVANDELIKKKKQNKIAFGVVLGAFLFVILVLVLSFCLPESDSSDNSSASEYEQLTDVEQATEVDNSVNGKGYYYFDNTMEEAIQKYRQIVAETDESGLENTIDNVTMDRFEKIENAIFLENEEVTNNSYVYHNGETGVLIFPNADNKVVAFAYQYTYEFLSSISNNGQGVQTQFFSKPAKWLYALSDNLTYDEAYEIYETLYRQHLNAVSNAEDSGNMEISHYYKGYTLLVSSTASTENITIIKSDSDFAESNGIYAGGKSIFQPAN